MRLETVREQDAYDEGFANGKDYWMPLEQDRILQIIEHHLIYATKNSWPTEPFCTTLIALIKGENK